MWYNVDGEDLKNIANKIRAKGNTSSPLPFPYGFVSAIENIQTVNPTLIEKTITANGLYNAISDGADGYSSVLVSVGSQNIISGTFTASESEKGTVKIITIPYLGNGYPYAMMIYPSYGPYKSGTTMYDTIQPYAINSYFMIKSDMSTAPDFADTSDKNRAFACSVYKNSDTIPTSYNRNSYMDVTMYRNQDATAASVDCIRFNNAITMQVFIANTSYGFMAGVEYTYRIFYSS